MLTNREKGEKADAGGLIVTGTAYRRGGRARIRDAQPCGETAGEAPETVPVKPAGGPAQIWAKRRANGRLAGPAAFQRERLEGAGLGGARRPGEAGRPEVSPAS